MVGRYISEPYADGSAIYLIIKENKKTVRLKVVENIGDDWVIPHWGREVVIDKDYVITKIKQRDWMYGLRDKNKTM